MIEIPIPKGEYLDSLESPSPAPGAGIERLKALYSFVPTRCNLWNGSK